MHEFKLYLLESELTLEIKAVRFSIIHYSNNIFIHMFLQIIKM